MHSVADCVKIACGEQHIIALVCLELPDPFRRESSTHGKNKQPVGTDLVDAVHLGVALWTKKRACTSRDWLGYAMNSTLDWPKAQASRQLVKDHLMLRTI